MGRRGRELCGMLPLTAVVLSTMQALPRSRGFAMIKQAGVTTDRPNWGFGYQDRGTLSASSMQLGSQRLASLGRAQPVRATGQRWTCHGDFDGQAQGFTGGSVQYNCHAVMKAQPGGAGRLSSFGRRVQGAFSRLLRFESSVSLPMAAAVGVGTLGLRKNIRGPYEGAPEGNCFQSSQLVADRAPPRGSGGGRQKRVLILMSDTGGGHRASAQALKAAFDDLYPGEVHIDIVDIWTQYGLWPFNSFVEGYAFMAKNPPIWRLFWEYGKFPLTRCITTELSNFICHDNFRKCIEEHGPDLVISVHPLCQDIPMRVLKRMGGGERQVPFVTVVTDLGGAHPTWFHRDIDRCFVPSEALQELARAEGLRDEQIRLVGLPIRRGFWDDKGPRKADLQKKLGLTPGIKTCLVVGGGDGVGGLAGIAIAAANKLGESLDRAQVVVVCGKNEEAVQQLQKTQFPPNVQMHIKGFVNNMDEWMGAVDVIVTKAGPGTIAEATTRGLPVMLSAYLPGQEEGNIPFVEQGGFGTYAGDPKTIANTVSGWLQDDKKLALMGQRSKEASRPKATADIAREIGDLLFGGKPPKARRQGQSAPLV